MRVSAQAEYACIAVLELAAHQDEPTPVPVKTIAEMHGIPQRYLVQILLRLKGAGYVASTRGATGGYQLALPPDQITLADIMIAIDGDDAFPSAHKPAASPRSPATHAIVAIWNDVLQSERRALNEVTFADLVERMKRPAEDMYYI